MPCDFDYIWDEAILMLELVDGGLLTKSGHIIDTIILPPNCTIKDDIARKLNLFCRSGGRIISVFRYNPMLEKEAILCSELSSLKGLVNPPVSVSPGSMISLCTRIGEGKTVYMLLNESPEDTEVDICINSKGMIYEANLIDGSLTLISAERPFRFLTGFYGCELKVFIADTMVSGNAPSDSITIKPGTVRRRKTGIEPYNWQVTLPDSKEVRLDGKKWPDWASLGWPEYSGYIKYTAYFDYDLGETDAILCMPFLHYHAIVSVDGKEAGRIAYKPYELILRGLSKGRHKLEIKVYNTGANEVVCTIEAEKKRYSKRFAHMAAYDRKRIKSGLLGPVTIYPAE